MRYARKKYIRQLKEGIKRETIGASEKENRSYVDYYNLRNNLIVYFKQPREFDFDEMMNCVFGKYEPEHPRLINMNKLKDKVQEKLLSSKYDTAFTIAPQAVKKKYEAYIQSQFLCGGECSIRGRKYEKFN